MRLTHPTVSIFMHAVVAVLLLVGAPIAQAQEDCELNGKSINLGYGPDTAGQSGMVRCKDRDTGKLVREHELRNGDGVGLVRYFKNGVLALEFSALASGARDGREREFAANGQLVYEATYVKGQVRGIVRRWYDTGAPKRVEYVGDSESERAWVEYLSTGQWATLRCGNRALLAPHVDDAALCGFKGSPSTVSTYSTNGQLRSTTTWLVGQVQRATLFYNNGKPQEEEERKGALRTERFYAEDGQKRREKVWDEGQTPVVLQRESEYAASGTLVRERLYAVADMGGRKRNVLQADARFYLNGQPQSKAQYGRDGATEFYDMQRFSDSGKLKQQGRYVMAGGFAERPVGVHLSYNEAGRVEQELSYDQRGNVSRERRWDGAGNLLVDEQLFEDGSRKAYAQ